MKKKQTKIKLPRRFCVLTRKLAVELLLRRACREMGILLSPDTKKEISQRKKDWLELESFIDSKDAKIKARLLVSRYSYDVLNLKV